MRKYAVILTTAAVLGLVGPSSWAAGSGPGPGQAAPAAGAAPKAAPTGGDDLAQQEQAARTEATLATVRLELILARKALRDERYEEAARKACRVLALVKQVPSGAEAGEFELQAEGVLAKAARQGVDVEALRRQADQAAVGVAPGEANLDAKVQQAARLARQYTGSTSKDMDTRGDERALRERTLQRQTPDRYGYRPAREIVDTPALDVRDDQRVYYQAALEGAYKDSETQALVEAAESRVVADGVVSYPPDWPEKMKKREQYRGGMIARTPSWTDQDGREWYVAVYDVRDLIYVPPDFTTPAFNPLIAQRDALDRDALRWQSWIFRGGPDDLAAGIPLLRYFGGVDDTAYRGPKYSRERQQQLVELIKAFTGPPPSEPQVIPLAP
jgi:hypothetical protein